MGRNTRKSEPGRFLIEPDAGAGALVRGALSEKCFSNRFDFELQCLIKTVEELAHANPHR